MHPKFLRKKKISDAFKYVEMREKLEREILKKKRKVFDEVVKRARKTGGVILTGLVVRNSVMVRKLPRKFSGKKVGEYVLSKMTVGFCHLMAQDMYELEFGEFCDPEKKMKKMIEPSAANGERQGSV